MMMTRTGRFLAGTLALALAGPAFAQAPELTVERLYGSREFSANTVGIRWAADGQHYTTVQREHGLTDLYEVDVRSGERRLLVRGEDLTPAAGRVPISISGYLFSADRSKLLIYTDVERIWRRSSQGTYYVWDFRSRTLTPLSSEPGRQRYAKFSPDGARVAFVRDNDIYVTELSSGRETALTDDGSDVIINGTTDWVYEEELSLVDGFRWSPDGRRIAFWRFDQSPIREYFLVDQSTLYPELTPIRYPLAGTANSNVRLGVIEIETGATTWIEPGSQGGENYIARMDFIPSSGMIWFQKLNRFQNRTDLMLADPQTGQSHVLMTDSSDAWIDIDFNQLLWIDGGSRFLYLSERDGFAHLYLFQQDGRLIRKLTAGDWDVLDTYGVDERLGIVYFSAAADGPLVRPLYRVGLDGTGFQRLTGRDGTHRVSFDPTFTYYLDTYSRAGLPPVQAIRTTDGETVRELTDNSALEKKLADLDLNRPEFITVPAADGTPLNAWIIKPPDFDPSRRYPLLLYVYGGPGSQTVTDSWGGNRYLWHQILAREGYLVASVDNRGTGARGAKFKNVVYLDLGHHESDDQIAAAHHFAALPYVDGDRIGIWGWSYGGYMASLCIFKGAGVFKAAISGAPVTDWRLYDTIYTERYMRTPQENPEGYARSASQTYADRLLGRLLLIHGTGDDNVHFQNTTQLVARLVEANKQFDLRIYPNQPHGIQGSIRQVNLNTLMLSFLKENL